jgi:predicted DNA-binding ribbon-helix-helix protein
MTINEDRDRMSLPRYDFPEADMPFIRTSRGIVFIDGASKLVPAGEAIDQITGARISDADSDGVMDAPVGPDTDTGGTPDDPAATADAGRDPERDAAVKAERSAFRRWAAKRSAHARPFQCTVLTKADAPDLADDNRIAFADPTPGGGDGPKVGSTPVGTWPGWDHDQTIADTWAARIQQAATRGIDPQTLAERWLSHQLTKAAPNAEEPPPDSHAALDIAAAAATAWLLAQGIDLAGGLMQVVGGLWTEGWALGAASAAAVLRGDRAIRLPWLPGDVSSARRSLTPGQEQQLAAWSKSLADTLEEVADRRRSALGRLLARFRGTRRNSIQLAQAIRDLLADPAWAQRLALTELSSAQAQAAAAVYQAAGITNWQWTTEPGACPACLANEAEGPIPLGQAWPDGSQSPPGHPNCRCSLLPAP